MKTLLEKASTTDSKNQPAFTERVLAGASKTLETFEKKKLKQRKVRYPGVTATKEKKKNEWAAKLILKGGGGPLPKKRRQSREKSEVSGKRRGEKGRPAG